ncbi:MAG: class I SAM-dependent RNA methyltransferase [Sphaerochaeta sp.]|jgi:23S rRNA (uracil1939-C5)-methyltransferase|nr:class I SAM-dependent RNA methyltransferase [Sphaerochaeta sp.]MDX9914288.1 class I SAM-dependent RNA methyltransferase [Sphaerochaeta sp.]
MLLSIEKLVSQGRALALGGGGKQVLVREALPEEVVEAAIEREHASYTMATTTTVVEPNPRRITPPCPYWGICGGCDFQYAEATYQAEVKEAIVIDSLERIGGVKADSYDIQQQVTGSGWDYRSRARFFVDLHQRRVGFLGRLSNTLVPIDHCPVLVPPLNALLSDPKRLFDGARREMFANRITKSGLVEVAAFADQEQAVLLGEEIRVEVGPKDFVLSPTVFFQSNLHLLPALGAYVSSLVEGETVMDLYSGVGTFASFVEEAGRTVIAVERQKQCLAFARRNAPNARFFTEAAETWAKRQTVAVETIIVDPPRTGLDAALPSLMASWKPRRIIYVSCDEASLARDVKRFGQYGYLVRSLRLFDLYPQTFHTESVVLLTSANDA